MWHYHKIETVWRYHVYHIFMRQKDAEWMVPVPFCPNSNACILTSHSRVGECGDSVVECRTPEREVGGLKPTAAVLCPWARHFTPRKYWLITQEAVAPSRHDWKIVDWDVKPQHKQTNHSRVSGPQL